MGQVWKEHILETTRLILRPWTTEDAEECFRNASDPLVGPPAGWKPHKDVEESRQVIRRILAVPETYAIVLKETGLPIGSIALHQDCDLAEEDDEAELGYWLGTRYWGMGIVPEAARRLLRHAFEDLKLERIWCGYYNGNERSRRVQEKLGFRYQWTTEGLYIPQVGETRTGNVSLMTKEDWDRNKSTISVISPGYRDLWFRQMMLADPETMSYNHSWGGTIDFPRDDWKDWYDHWIEDNEGKRFYRFIADGTGAFLGEIAYHLDEKNGIHIADVIIYAPFRRKGFGALALEYLCQCAKENGISELYDDIAIDNPAISLFLSHGFSEEYRTDAIIMLKKVL